MPVSSGQCVAGRVVYMEELGSSKIGKHKGERDTHRERKKEREREVPIHEGADMKKE